MLKQQKRTQRAIILSSVITVPVCMYFCASLAGTLLFDAFVRSATEAEAVSRKDMLYFNTLTAKEQQLYDTIVDAAEEISLRSNSVMFVPTAKEYANAMQAAVLDHPVCFWLRAEECSLTVGAYTAFVQMAYCDEVKARRVQLDSVIDPVIKEASDHTDDRERAGFLRSRLLAMCEPMPLGGRDIGHTAYDALVSGTADGFGYALAYELLCEAAGIPCETVTGTVNGKPHAWNALTLDGVTGYTDVMWDDVPGSTASDSDTPQFHGYDFLSYAEMALDHTPDTPALWAKEDTVNAYEAAACYAENADALPQLLTRLLSDARANGQNEIEFCVGEMLSDLAMEEYLHRAITEANAAVSDGDIPLLRYVNRIYHASTVRNAVTVRLFYEEGET